MKRLLILAYSLPPAGGAEKVAWELAIRCVNRYETHLFVFSDVKLSKVINGVTVHFFPKRDNPLRYYLTFGRRSIIDLYNHISPDVIHAHGNTVFSHILRKQKAVRKIATFHHSYPVNYNWTNYRLMKFNYFSKEIVKEYDTLTTVSKHMQRYFSADYSKTVIFIPNGYNNNDFYIESDSIRKDKSILFVGQLTIAKGVDILFRLSDIMPDYTFTFVGNGILKNTVSKKNVYFVGVMSPNELRKYYNSNEYSVFPSKYENSPLVGLEAMACGSIAITSEKGFNQYIEHEFNGYLIASPDEFKIRDLILRNKNNDYIIENAISTVKRYTWEKIYEKYYEIYKR
jgi:glycosyltransferase involved in cell wall biosynthesis